MSNTKFTGTGVAIITPFNSDNSVDYPALERITENCVKGKLNYIVALGTTGEPVTLTKSEKTEVIHSIVKTVSKRIPIVIGISGNNTAEVVDAIKSADLHNIDGIL